MLLSLLQQIVSKIRGACNQMKKARSALGSPLEWNLGGNGIPITTQLYLQCGVQWVRKRGTFHPCIFRCLLFKEFIEPQPSWGKETEKRTLQTGRQKWDSSMSFKEAVSCQGLPYPWEYNWNLKLPWFYQGKGAVESLSFRFSDTSLTSTFSNRALQQQT